jgi:hypothetical protein
VQLTARQREKSRRRERPEKEDNLTT